MHFLDGSALCRMPTYILVVLCVYLYVIPPELQQRGKSSLHLAEELVEEGQLSHTILIQQGAQTWHTNITNYCMCAYVFYIVNKKPYILRFHLYNYIKFTN